MIPELEPHCGSWVVSRKADGSVIGEFFERSNVERFNPETCLIETAAQYLGRLNQGLREARALEERVSGPGCRSGAVVSL